MLTHKTRLKPLTREPKKSVLEPELKNILTPKTPTHN
ncbi:zormin, isoform C [Helicobacter pylori v225d]|nr:zormin, isoform C [Helicobacter pylori v225d]